MRLTKFYIFLLIPFLAFAQNPNKDIIAPPPKDDKPATTTGEDKPKDKPLKHVDGSVVVDPRNVSINYKNANLATLKKLKNSLINFEMEEDYKKLMKSYIEATILLQERKYPEARKAFETNSDDLNSAAQKVIEKNKQAYDKLFKDTSQQVVEMKVEAAPGDNFVPSLEKNLAIATDTSLGANHSTNEGNYVEAVERHKKSNFLLIKILYAINKNKHKNLKIAERLQKNLLIEEDYIPNEYQKLYDDSRGLLFSEREEDRKKERERMKKSISTRYGEISNADQNKDSNAAPKDNATPGTDKPNPADDKSNPPKAPDKKD